MTQKPTPSRLALVMAVGGGLLLIVSVAFGVLLLLSGEIREPRTIGIVLIGVGLLGVLVFFLIRFRRRR